MDQERADLWAKRATSRMQSMHAGPGFLGPFLWTLAAVLFVVGLSIGLSSGSSEHLAVTFMATAASSVIGLMTAPLWMWPRSRRWLGRVTSRLSQDAKAARLTLDDAYAAGSIDETMFHESDERLQSMARGHGPWTGTAGAGHFLSRGGRFVLIGGLVAAAALTAVGWLVQVDHLGGSGSQATGNTLFGAAFAFAAVALVLAIPSMLFAVHLGARARHLLAEDDAWLEALRRTLLKARRGT